MVVGAAIGVVWFWIPLGLLVVGVSSIPSVIGFCLAAVVFVYLVRGIDRVERVRSEAVFGMRIGRPAQRVTPYTGFQGWLHQLWLDVSSARFWKVLAHHYLRMLYDILATALAFALLAFAFLGPAAASRSTTATTRRGWRSCRRRWRGRWPWWHWWPRSRFSSSRRRSTR